jgi:cobaltochelatase CobN
VGNAVGWIRRLAVCAAAGDAGQWLPDGPLPDSSDALMHSLIDRGCYDTDYLSADQLRQAVARVPLARYQQWFAELPAPLQQRMLERWGAAPGTAYVDGDQLVFAGMELGNAFVALQPPRGYGMDPDAIYHTPDLPPTHHYYALYCWLRDEWQADAIVHVGKHGTLEWLPGKGVGVSNTASPMRCWATCPCSTPSSSTIRARARRPSAAPIR